MARSHGRIMAAIWNDADFLALDTDAQRLYMFLCSQPDLSHAGLVPMRIRRWAKKADNTSESDIEDSLNTLSQARFIVLDYDTEEVLLRTFVRNDGVYKQPKVMIRLREDAAQIESPQLRVAFRAELDRLPLHELSDKPGGPNADHPSTRETVAGIVDTLRGDFQDAPGYPSEGVSDTHPDTPRVGARAFPQPPTPVPHPPSPSHRPPSPAADAAPRDERAETEPDRFEEFWETYSHKVGRKKAEAAYRAALKKPGVTAELLIASAAAYITWQMSEDKHPAFTKHPTTWLHGEHWRDERPARIAAKGGRVSEHLALVQQLAAEEAAAEQQPHLQIGSNR